MTYLSAPLSSDGAAHPLPPIEAHPFDPEFEAEDGPIFGPEGRLIGSRRHGIDYYSAEPYPDAWGLHDSGCRITPEQMDVRSDLVTEVMWATHNLLAHPFSEACHWLGFIWAPIRDFGLWVHDATIPPHAPNTGRG